VVHTQARAKQAEALEAESCVQLQRYLDNWTAVKPHSIRMHITPLRRSFPANLITSANKPRFTAPGNDLYVQEQCRKTQRLKGTIRISDIGREHCCHLANATDLINCSLGLVHRYNNFVQKLLDPERRLRNSGFGYWIGSPPKSNRLVLFGALSTPVGIKFY